MAIIFKLLFHPSPCPELVREVISVNYYFRLLTGVFAPILVKPFNL